MMFYKYSPKKVFAFYRSEERFSRNAETDLVCRLLLEKKQKVHLQGAGEDGTVPLRPDAPHVAPAHRPRQSRSAQRAAQQHQAAHQLHPPVSFFFNDTAPTEIYPLSLHAVFR